MDTRLVAMDGEADDVLLAPLATRKVVGVLRPLEDSVFQMYPAMVSVGVGSVYLLVTKSEAVHHVMVAAEYHAYGTVGTVA